MLSFINTYPSSNHQWLFLIPVLLITLAWSLNHSLWRVLFSFIKETSNPDNITSKAKTTNFTSLFLFLNYIFCGVLFFNSYFGDDSLMSFIIISSVLLIIPLFHWLFSLFFSFLTEQRAYFFIYNRHLYYQTCIVGILFFFSSLSFTYFPMYSYQTIIVTLSLLFLLSFLRLTLSSIKAIQTRFSPIYIILYLCTLEILPFIVFYYMYSNDLEALMFT